jgi:hypothetical protein
VTDLAYAAGAEAFVRNVLKVCEDRQADKFAELAVFAEPADEGGWPLELKQFQVFNNSARLNQKWPALTVTTTDEADAMAGGGLYFDADATLVAAVEITYPLSGDANEIGYRLMRYARAVKEMIREATQDEMTRGLDPQVAGIVQWEVTRIRYLTLPQQSDSMLKKLAMLDVKITGMEV